MVQEPNQPNPDLTDTGTASLVDTMRLGFLALRVIMGVLLVLYLFSGWFYVDSDEIAFVEVFGAVVKEDGKPKQYGSGQLHLTYPAPISRKVIVKVGEARQIPPGPTGRQFRPERGAQFDVFWYQVRQATVAQKAPQNQRSSGEITVGTDGYLLTGDQNIVHTRWNVAYSISDAYTWYTRFAEPEKAVEAALAETIIEEFSRMGIDQVLYSREDAAAVEAPLPGPRERIDIAAAVRDRLQRLVGPEGMNVGVTIDRVHLTDKQAPREAYNAFSQVLNAANERSTLISEAQTYKEQVVEAARGQASTVRSQALSDASELLASLEADAEYFRKIKEKADATPTILLGLYRQALEEVLRSPKAVYSIKANQAFRFRFGPGGQLDVDEQAE